jgi:hypothetical protein
MKKLFTLLLAVVMVLSLCACSNDSNEKNEDGNKTADSGNNATTVPATAPTTAPTTPTEPADDRVALNVFAGVTVKFKDAMNGFGESFTVEFDHTKVNYDKTNTDIKNFLQSIEFSHNAYKNLSNGDEIVVNASWSKSTADALGVKLLEISHVYTVAGLYDVYRSTEGLSKETKVIEGIKSAIAGEIVMYKSDRDFRDDHDVSYRYYAAYGKDRAGNPYITMIYVTAVADLVGNESGDISKTPFLGYNYLYQEYWEECMAPQAEESDRVSINGELSEVGGVVKLEEFFLN